MKHPNMMSKRELVELVSDIRDELFLVKKLPSDCGVFNPEKDVGADAAHNICGMLQQAELAPSEKGDKPR